MSLRIYGNRQLKTLPGQETRPTPAKVRQAVFNIWPGVEGCRWLDLCAGCGAMGAEALGRGAAIATGIELAPAACRVIHQNWEKVAQPGQQFQVIKGDVRRQLSRLRSQTFDYIYFDPPYGSDLYDGVLATVVRLGLLDPKGEIAVEHQPELWQAREIPGLENVRQKRYGTTHLTFYAPIP
ncbi:16S rRNA (guanine(966)-N(2))-methyltransferase RsmD [filamentous cyanobacterium CCP5]|nr:16S rRNA (guanine(966)-N(2))-methyltransferase RsmD [filamentous cyanobacterium CCP5]